jgi:hypothetical protein
LLMDFPVPVPERRKNMREAEAGSGDGGGRDWEAECGFAASGALPQALEFSPRGCWGPTREVTGERHPTGPGSLSRVAKRNGFSELRP